MNTLNYLVRKAFSEGINNGRQGKGSIYVFASGNGGRHEDQCNFDGYTNSTYSVTVGAVDHTGRHSTYSEACAANLNMIVAYSSGSGKHIVCYHSPSTGFLCTPDHFVIDCYRSRERHVRSYTHSGTSAAAPNAAGDFALALEARLVSLSNMFCGRFLKAFLML